MAFLAVDFFWAFVVVLAAEVAFFVAAFVALVAFLAVLLADLTAFLEAVAFFATVFFAAFLGVAFFAGAFFAVAFFVTAFFVVDALETAFFGVAFATFLTAVAFFLTVPFVGAARFLTRSAVSELLMAAAAPTTPSRAFLPAASAATSRVPTACPILRATRSSLFFATRKA